MHSRTHVNSRLNIIVLAAVTALAVGVYLLVARPVNHVAPAEPIERSDEGQERHEVPSGQSPGFAPTPLTSTEPPPTESVSASTNGNHGTVSFLVDARRDSRPERVELMLSSDDGMESLLSISIPEDLPLLRQRIKVGTWKIDKISNGWMPSEHTFSVAERQNTTVDIIRVGSFSVFVADGAGRPVSDATVVLLSDSAPSWGENDPPTLASLGNEGRFSTTDGGGIAILELDQPGAATLFVTHADIGVEQRRVMPQVGSQMSITLRPSERKAELSVADVLTDQPIENATLTSVASHTAPVLLSSATGADGTATVWSDRGRSAARLVTAPGYAPLLIEPARTGVDMPAIARLHPLARLCTEGHSDDILNALEASSTSLSINQPASGPSTLLRQWSSLDILRGRIEVPLSKTVTLNAMSERAHARGSAELRSPSDCVPLTEVSHDGVARITLISETEAEQLQTVYNDGSRLRHSESDDGTISIPDPTELNRIEGSVGDWSFHLTPGNVLQAHTASRLELPELVEFTISLVDQQSAGVAGVDLSFHSIDPSTLIDGGGMMEWRIAGAPPDRARGTQSDADGNLELNLPTGRYAYSLRASHHLSTTQAGLGLAEVGEGVFTVSRNTQRIALPAASTRWISVGVEWSSGEPISDFAIKWAEYDRLFSMAGTNGYWMGLVPATTNWATVVTASGEASTFRLDQSQHSYQIVLSSTPTGAPLQLDSELALPDRLLLQAYVDPFGTGEFRYADSLAVEAVDGQYLLPDLPFLHGTWIRISGVTGSNTQLESDLIRFEDLLAGQIDLIASD